MHRPARKGHPHIWMMLFLSHEMVRTLSGSFEQAQAWTEN